MWLNKDGTPLKDTMRRFTIWILNGNINPNVIEWILGCRNIPANKIKPGHPDSIRPINIDSAPFKIITMLAKDIMCDEMKVVMDPYQMRNTWWNGRNDFSI
eukprot:222206_1